MLEDGVNQGDLLSANIDWFRQASPYINAHRGKTMVLCFGGQLLDAKNFPTLIHDITLLRHLGVRLVLVHGLRLQVEKHLEQMDPTIGALTNKLGLESDIRVTDDDAMDFALAEIGTTRIKIESMLSMGLPNTPMAGAHLNVASGNFVTAQPFGVHGGVDYQHTGRVRQIQTEAIIHQIDNGQLALLSPLGYSMTGEVFRLQAGDVAMRAAIALGAEKLIYLVNEPIKNAQQQTVRETSVADTAALLAEPDNHSINERNRMVLERAMNACRSGVKRVHLLHENEPQALLRELFTRDGAGMLVSNEDYDTMRAARTDDLGGIIELVRPLEDDGTLVKRSREQLELDIRHYTVCEREGMITACAALIRADEDDTMAEIACLVTHPAYQKGGRAEKLLKHLEKQAVEANLNSLYVLTTRTGHWFIEQGFVEASPERLPRARQSTLDQTRNSKVLIKSVN